MRWKRLKVTAVGLCTIIAHHIWQCSFGLLSLKQCSFSSPTPLFLLFPTLTTITMQLSHGGKEDLVLPGFSLSLTVHSYLNGVPITPSLLQESTEPSLPSRSLLSLSSTEPSDFWSQQFLKSVHYSDYSRTNLFWRTNCFISTLFKFLLVPCYSSFYYYLHNLGPCVLSVWWINEFK